MSSPHSRGRPLLCFPLLITPSLSAAQLSSATVCALDSKSHRGAFAESLSTFAVAAVWRQEERKRGRQISREAADGAAAAVADGAVEQSAIGVERGVAEC